MVALGVLIYHANCRSLFRYNAVHVSYCCHKREADAHGVAEAAKAVANSTLVARAAIQRRFSAPGGRVKSPLPGVTIAPPASAPPRTSEAVGRFTYAPGDAFMYEQRRTGPAYDAMVAGVAATVAVDRLEFEVGHSYWDDNVR